MAASSNWAFPDSLQPSTEELRFELEAALAAVLMVRTETAEDAFTAPILGTERVGSGVVIGGDGLVLTIGYLITEAETIWLSANDGTLIAGYPLAYDFPTGLGLVQPLGRLGIAPLQRGSARTCTTGDDVLVIGNGGRPHALKARIIDKREFAGYWEYVLDEAMFTAPAHPEWGGSALVGMDGRLLGVGSLLVQEVMEGQQIQGNMFVPVDLLEPILGDLLSMGQANRPPRPWLGMYTTEANGQLVVAGLAKGAPAERAGVQPGDVVIEVAGERAHGLADLFRKVWRLGSAGIEVPLTLARDGNLMRARVRSADRGEYLKKPRMH